MTPVASAFRRKNLARRKILVAILLLLLAPVGALAQDPVHWSAKLAPGTATPGGRIEVLVSATVDEEWHVYSITQGPGGPVATTVAVGPRAIFTRDGVIGGPKPVTAFDRNFDIDTETYEAGFTLAVPVRIAAGAPAPGATLLVEVRYQACTSRLCLPPATVALNVPLRFNSQLPTPNSQLPTPNSQFTPNPQSTVSNPESAVSNRQSAMATVHFGTTAEGNWSAFLWLAMSMGALSLLTPCVFPMVPITVSYFTNNAAATRGLAVRSALVYGAGIVLTFTLFGAGLAAVAGAAGLTRFAANPWVNLGITALFLVFALNLFGVFDIRLPFRLLSRVDAASRRHGASVAGTLLMASTFTITSLTCTAAFLGTLLVVASQGEWQRPVAGLLAYSATFALPFVVLAAAPQLASQLPRSGPWLARVKVAMGFLEIAAAMKFLSNADLVLSWGVFTRDVVLVSWIAIAVALAIYIVGRQPRLSRVAAATVVAAFAAWLATGLQGRRLGELEAFLPPATHAEGRGELAWITDDLDAAMAQARVANQRVFIDFTGYTCTNCRWMEANMFPRDEVRDRLQRFVRARLYTDGRGARYEQQQRYQQEQFKTVALPLYAIVEADGRTIATFAGLTRDPAEFMQFLDVPR